MQNNIREEVFMMIVCCLSLFGIWAGMEFLPKEQKQEPQKETIQTPKVNIRQLRSAKDSLMSVYDEYQQKQVSFAEQSKLYKVQNPQYNNMDCLYVLVRKLYKSMSLNYNNQEAEFLVQLKNTGKRFCNKNGKYRFKDCGHYWTPVGLEDWVCVIDDNAKKFQIINT